MIYSKPISLFILVAYFCAYIPPANAGNIQEFRAGLTAINANDFALASKIFSKLSGEGDFNAMHNLGLSLMMVNRKDEAFYWFNKACRYGSEESKKVIESLGEVPPPHDLVGTHPTLIQAKENEELVKTFVEVVSIGLVIAVAGYALSNGYYSNNRNIYTRSLNLVDDYQRFPQSNIGFESTQSNQTDPVGISNTTRQIEARPKFDYDPNNKFSGSVNGRGEFEMKNIYTQEKLKGEIDRFGEGYAKDSNGNKVKIQLECAPVCNK